MWSLLSFHLYMIHATTVISNPWTTMHSTFYISDRSFRRSSCWSHCCRRRGPYPRTFRDTNGVHSVFRLHFLLPSVPCEARKSEAVRDFPISGSSNVLQATEIIKKNRCCDSLQTEHWQRRVLRKHTTPFEYRAKPVCRWLKHLRLCSWEQRLMTCQTTHLSSVSPTILWFVHGDDSASSIVLWRQRAPNNQAAMSARLCYCQLPRYLFFLSLNCSF